MTNNAKLFELLQQRAAANLAKELNKDEKKVETTLNLSKTTETKEATQTVEEVTNKEVANKTTETKEATQTTNEEVVETVKEEATQTVEEVEVTTENVEEESTEADSTTGTTGDDKPKNSNAALMALMAQRQTSSTGNGRSNSNTSKNKKEKEKEVFMYEHVSEVESIIYFNGDEVGRIPKQALIPDANYPKFIRETIIPHIKQASMDQFRFRPQGADWYLEPNPVYAEKFHKQG